MIKVFNQLKVLLDKKQKKNFIFLSILMVIFSLLEFLSIGIIIPISTLILDGSLNSNISNPNFFGLDKIFEDQNKLLTIFFVIFLSNFSFALNEKFLSLAIEPRNPLIREDNSISFPLNSTSSLK